MLFLFGISKISGRSAYTNSSTSNTKPTTAYPTAHTPNPKPRTSYFIGFILLLLISASFLSSCKIYSFKNVTIPPEVKTIKIGFIRNKATYINPQLSPRLTDRLQQKISNQTRLTRTNNDDADWIIDGEIRQYYVTTTGISNQQASINRLTVSVHIVFKSTLANTTQEFDATRNFDFSANRTLQEAEPSLNEEILRNLSDEIFNRLFSNW